MRRRAVFTIGLPALIFATITSSGLAVFTFGETHTELFVMAPVTMEKFATAGTLDVSKVNTSDNLYVIFDQNGAELSTQFVVRYTPPSIVSDPNYEVEALSFTYDVSIHANLMDYLVPSSFSRPLTKLTEQIVPNYTTYRGNWADSEEGKNNIEYHSDLRFDYTEKVVFNNESDVKEMMNRVKEFTGTVTPAILITFRSEVL